MLIRDMKDTYVEYLQKELASLRAKLIEVPVSKGNKDSRSKHTRRSRPFERYLTFNSCDLRIY